MKSYKCWIATLCVAIVFYSGGAVFANTNGLEANDEASLSYLREFSMFKRDIYSSSAFFCTFATEDDCAPLFLSLARKQQKHMNALKDLLVFYGISDPLLSEEHGDYSEGFLDDDDLNIRTFVGWMPSYTFILENVAYLEEMNIRDLRLAIDETDEHRLISAYTKLISDNYVHLLQLASILHDDPLDYTSQILGAEEVEQILLDAMDLESKFTINAGLNDAWYDSATDGQGFMISVFEDKGTVFLAWFTFDTELPGAGSTANLGDAGQRWLTAEGEFDGSQAELVVYSSSGGLFNAALPVPELNEVGSIILQFDDCFTGMVSYDLPEYGESGSIPIERTASDNIALCQAMNPAVLSSVDVGGNATERASESCYISEGEVPAEYSRLFAVWGNGSNDVFAVGGSGTILHFDGTNWTPMAWGGGFGFEGVWGSSGNDVYAVGGADGFGLAYGIILHYDGSCWREVFSTTEYQFTDVWGSNENDVFAATSRGPVLHFDGTGWEPMESGTETMDGTGGVWGTGADNVLAVGGDTIWRYDGNSWQSMATVNANSLRRVWGSSTTDVFAVGANYTPSQTEAAVWHYDGSSWKFMPSDIEGMRWSVWGSSANNVFAVGDRSGKGLISHYDGIDWKTLLVDNTPTLQGVWGSSANDIFAVGGGARNGFCCSGAGTILHFDGTAWQTIMEYGQFK